MAEDQATEEPEWLPRFRVDEEMEFFTDLALQETERWIQVVTKKRLTMPDDLRQSLQNGVLLCELVNCIRPATIKRINRLHTPIAGLDNLNVFLKACRHHLGLKDSQLFDPLDLEDLTQRAAFSDDNPLYLKQETDRRLRNVAHTVYWLGRVASETYDGPQLDLSAYSGLISHNIRDAAVLSPEHSPRHKGWNSYHVSPSGHGNVTNTSDHSSRLNNSGYSLNSSENSNSQLNFDICNLEENAARSVDSYGSYDRSSEEGFTVELQGDMPGKSNDMYRPNSSTNLTSLGGGLGSQGNKRHSGNYDSSNLYTRNNDSGMYRSSPNLSQGSHSRTRSSSTDSLDGYQGFHSRQSSDSVENYPTRVMSAEQRRKNSTTSNPLQFIKTVPADTLAKTAAEQMKIAQETKKIKWDTLQETTDDADWQSKLGNWKIKRKNQSAAAYERKEEIEAMGKENEEKAGRSTKTFKEIMEDRQKRKSVNTYPIEDEDDNANMKHISPSNNERNRDLNHNNNDQNRLQPRSTTTTTTRQTTGSFDDTSTTEVAPWVMSSDEDEKDVEQHQQNHIESCVIGNGVPSESDTESNKENWTEQNNNNGHYSDNVYEQDNNIQVTTDLPMKRRTGYSAMDSGFTNKRDDFENKRQEFEEKDKQTNNPPSDQRRISSSAKINNILKAFEEKNENDTTEYKPIPRIKRETQKMTSNERHQPKTEPIQQPKLSPRSPRSEKDFVEKTITISQKPNSEKGFGFSFSGGRDKSKPIVVERVSLGGAADVCEVRIKDEIIAINRRVITSYSHTQVEDLIKRCVRTGKLELKVKRYLSKGSTLSDVFSDEETFEEYENKMEEENSKEDQRRSNTNTALTPMMDSLLRESRETNSDNLSQQQQQQNPWEDNNRSESYEAAEKEEEEEEDWMKFRNQRWKKKTESLEQVKVEPEWNRNESNEQDDQVMIEQKYEPVEAVEQYLTDDTSCVDPPELQTPSREVREPIIQSAQQENAEEEPVLRSWKKPANNGYSANQILGNEEYDLQPKTNITAEPGQPISFDFTVPTADSGQSDESGFGPPKALLRWQRRPKSQYGSEDKISRNEDAQQQRPKSMNLTQFTVESSSTRDVRKKPAPWQPVEDEQEVEPSVDIQEEEVRPMSAPRARLNLSRELQKMQEWDRLQEQHRQPDATTRRIDAEQEAFERGRQKIASQWERDQQLAEIKQEENKRNDQLILEQELKRVEEMEEHKRERQAQRKAKMAQLQIAPENSTDYQPPSGGQQFSEMVIQLPPKVKQEPLKIDPASWAAPPDLTVDTSDGAYPEVNFRVNLSQKSSEDERRQLELVDQERRRLQEEERQMRRQLEQEKEQETRRLQEREERLQQHEEQLRQEKERLRLEQEQLRREREQHLQAVQSPPRGISPAVQYGRLEYITNNLSPTYHSSSSASSLSPSGVNYDATNPQFSSTVIIANSSPDNYYVKGIEHAPIARPFKGDNTRQTANRTSERLTREDLMAMSRSARPLEDKPPSTQPPSEDMPVNSAIQSRESQPRESPLSPNSASAITRQPPNKREKHSLNAAPKQRFRQSSEWIGGAPAPEKLPERRSIEPTPARRQVEPTPARRSDIVKKQYSSPQDHWLVREAERRRLEEQSNKNNKALSNQRSHGQLRVPYTGGPIKPHEDIGNRWRDNLAPSNSSLSTSRPPRENTRSSAASQSFEQMRQKFTEPTPSPRTSITQFPKARNPALQPRAAPRQSSAPNNQQYHSRDESTPDRWQPQNSANSINNLANNNPRGGESQSLSPRPAPRSRNGPTGDLTSPEPTVAVSGKQQCSQCEQELGYGAAMVIESLNLHYHMQCFRCCVCRTQLGNGAHGADVRVRGWKLHCRNCYSNDEAGLKFSKV